MKKVAFNRIVPRGTVSVVSDSHKISEIKLGKMCLSGVNSFLLVPLFTNTK